MGLSSNIEWCDATWNPIMGCSRVSEGCRHCYAETIAGRFGRKKDGTKKSTVYDGLTQIVNGKSVWTGKIVETKKLLEPISWKNPKRVFVNSMSDLFHENVTTEQVDKIFAVMASCPRHTFQVLTKRPERMLAYISDPDLQDRLTEAWQALDKDRETWSLMFPLKNVWLGTSAENQKCFDERVMYLDKLHYMKWTIFLSLEPLLGIIDVEYPKSLFPNGAPMCCDGQDCGCRGMPVEPPLIYGIDWVIVGGESGHGARPMQTKWASDIQQACARWNIPYFFKQQGMWIDAGHDEFGRLPAGKIAHYDSEGVLIPAGDPRLQDENADVNTMKWVGRKRAGKTLYGKTYQEFPA